MAQNTLSVPTHTYNPGTYFTNQHQSKMLASNDVDALFTLSGSSLTDSTLTLTFGIQWDLGNGWEDMSVAVWNGPPKQNLDGTYQMPEMFQTSPSVTGVPIRGFFTTNNTVTTAIDLTLL